MKHFQNLPTIEFAPTGFPTSELKNLFYTLDLIIQNDNFIELYVIEGIKRLDNISYELYGSTDHWWLLAKINNITDIVFDLPVDEEVLQKVALDRTLAEDDYDTIESVGALDFYVNEFETLTTENDLKRQIFIIKPYYMGQVITEIVKSL